MKSIVLKPGREKSVLQNHPWIFSGAVFSLPDFSDGDILPVKSHSGRHLGYGYFNKKSQIIGRMLSFDERDPIDAVQANIIRAVTLQNELLDPQTTARRLVNAEGDFLPGLIVDQYERVLVIQVATVGMHRLKDTIVETLKKACMPSCIVECSTSPSRKQEGLKPLKEVLFGSPCGEVLVHEGDLRFEVNPLEGQKTGFFLDLRSMRFLIRHYARGKKVLNCCSYTGAFSCHALRGGAKHVVSVDVSKEAIDKAKRHVLLNDLDAGLHEGVVDDVFAFIEREKTLDYNLVIVDPPAFAKQKKDIPNAVKAYRKLNQEVMQKIPSGSFLLTCSCSYHVDEALFKKLLFQAACGANRFVQIVQSHQLAFDHPISLYHPEGSYLKSFFLHVV